jgi:uncharacterized protein
MRKQSKLTALLAGVVLAGFTAGNPALAAPKGTLVLGSTNSTSSHYVVSAAMVKAIKAGIPTSNVSQIETGASVDNVRRLVKGEIDLGICGTDTAVQVLDGTGPFADGKGVSDLVALYAYDVSVLNIAVSEDSKVATINDLSGKKFNPGIRGSGAELMTRGVFRTLGVTPDWVPGTVKDAAAGIQNRQIAGYSKYGPGAGIDATLRELMVSTPMRLLGFDAAQQSKVTANIKGVNFVSIPNVMPGQPAVEAPAALIVYATRTAVMDDETAYAVAKSIYEHRQILVDAWPHLKNFDFKAQAFNAEKVGIKLHPGAKKFWESVN